MGEDYIDYLKELSINIGNQEIIYNVDDFLSFDDIIPRAPEKIKKDIQKSKNYIETKELNKELQESYKYYNKLKQNEKIEIEKERKLRNKVANNLREEKEFLTEEEYKIAFEQEYNFLKYGLI